MYPLEPEVQLSCAHGPRLSVNRLRRSRDRLALLRGKAITARPLDAPRPSYVGKTVHRRYSHKSSAASLRWRKAASSTDGKKQKLRATENTQAAILSSPFRFRSASSGTPWLRPSWSCMMRMTASLRFAATVSTSEALIDRGRPGDDCCTSVCELERICTQAAYKEYRRIQTPSTDATQHPIMQPMYISSGPITQCLLSQSARTCCHNPHAFPVHVPPRHDSPVTNTQAPPSTPKPKPTPSPPQPYPTRYSSPDSTRPPSH